MVSVQPALRANMHYYRYNDCIIVRSGTVFVRQSNGGIHSTPREGCAQLERWRVVSAVGSARLAVDSGRLLLVVTSPTPKDVGNRGTVGLWANETSVSHKAM